MGSAIAANVIQTIRARKRRREGYLPEKHTLTPLHVGSSDTESDNADVYVAKRRKEAEVDRVKSKGVQKSTKKSLVKKESKRATEQSKPIKVTGPRIQNFLQSWDHLFEPPIPYLFEPEVRKFYYKMELLDDGGIRTTINNVKIHLDEETLGLFWVCL
ncbi:hypothetical protein H5410_028561 [Solanum commersonii]|uniref:Uncharacterized protein n=1 Tax=Solanum commersonii TaxID=4109 RepID=A0A9J5Z4C9_SOLCO|nr:hypothetical protein H5410_028561 [Solanum commersonii]